MGQITIEGGVYDDPNGANDDLCGAIYDRSLIAPHESPFPPEGQLTISHFLLSLPKIRTIYKTFNMGLEAHWVNIS